MKQVNSSSLRSMIFVPAYHTKYLDRAVDFDADALILDLEDAVPPAYKSEARENLDKYVKRDVFKQPVYVRVNPLDSGFLLLDLEVAVQQNITGIIPTKIESDKDVIFYDKLLTQFEYKKDLEPGSIKLCPLIETGSAVLNAFKIAKASSRVNCLVLGGEDYLTDLDGLHKEHGASLIVPRSLIVMAARAAHLDVLDTPYLDVQNLEGFRNEAEKARELGFSGSLIIHPTQLPIANQVFAPSDEEVREARRVLEAVKESKAKGSAVTLLDDKLVGPPMEKRALNVLEKLNRINAKSNK
ncbi:MAG: CoA ester lyase [Ekhidna sp.]|nr:CoA ester lyase [Ekhidna sp.]